MKKIFVYVLIAMITGIANAGTSVDWYFQWGMYPHGGDVTSLDPSTGVAGSQSVLWQLVYAGSDNLIGDGTYLVDAGNAANGYVYGDDEIVFSRTTPAGGNSVFDGTLYSDAAFRTASETETTYSGLFYIRVFGDTTPTVGEWYYNSPTLSAVSVDLTDPSRSPQLFDGNTNGGVQGNDLNASIVAVPEPSSMALLALGLGVVALRRKFRK